MHYKTARLLICTFPYTWIDSLDRGDPGEYIVKCAMGYTFRFYPLLNWIYIYEKGKLTCRLCDSVHFDYIVSFMRRVYLAIHEGAKCSDWTKECFIRELNDMKPYRTVKV